MADTSTAFTPEELATRRARARSFEGSSIHEGYTPTDEDRAFLRPLIEGEISEQEAIERWRQRYCED